jgi:hypothetical protein
MMCMHTYIHTYTHTYSAAEAFSHLRKEFGGLLDDVYHGKADPSMQKVIMCIRTYIYTCMHAYGKYAEYIHTYIHTCIMYELKS